MGHLLGGTTKILLLAVDFGFIFYWLLVALNLIPHDWVFQNYADPNVRAWNWSFLPLDIAASITGFIGIKGRGNRELLIISSTLTSVAGGMAIAFWSIQGFFNLGWWAPNIILIASGITILSKLLKHPITSGL
jgi:hypothetical protein